jgi:hypothetical protein
VLPSSHGLAPGKAIARDYGIAHGAGVSPPGSPRLPYDQVPAPLRAAVDSAIGSPVVHVSPRSGGFSPGPAVVVTCADGTRAFVKAVGAPLNPDTPTLLRAEGAVAAELPDWLPVPRLRARLECLDGADEWLALVFDVVDGDCPALPWTPADAARALDAVGTFAEVATPCPVPGLLALADRVAEQLTAWQVLAGDAPEDLDPWEARRLDWLAEVPERLADRGGLVGDTLVHLDLRADNLLFTPDGGVVLVDWPWACRGAAWVDPVLLALDVAVDGRSDPVGLVADLPVVTGADPRDVTDFLLGMAGMWAAGMRRPAPPGLPTLREFQRRFHDAALAWAIRRMGR